jgi:hypothetical protein
MTKYRAQKPQKKASALARLAKLEKFFPVCRKSNKILPFQTS